MQPNVQVNSVARELLVPAVTGAVTIGMLFMISHLSADPNNVDKCAVGTFAVAAAICTLAFSVVLFFLRFIRIQLGIGRLFLLFLIYGWFLLATIAEFGSRNSGPGACFLFDWRILAASARSEASVYMSGIFLIGAIAYRYTRELLAREARIVGNAKSPWPVKICIGLGYTLATLIGLDLCMRMSKLLFGIRIPVHLFS